MSGRASSLLARIFMMGTWPRHLKVQSLLIRFFGVIHARQTRCDVNGNSNARCKRNSCEGEKSEVTYASPSSSESCLLRLAGFRAAFLLSGAAELSLLIFIGASSSSDEESPAKARSSSSISDILCESFVVEVASQRGSDVCWE